nr:hypothetical protein [Caldimonas sp.]
MNANKLAIVAVAFAGTLAAAAAQAHGRDDVQFSLTIGAPFVAPVRPVFAPAPVVFPAPVVRYENRVDHRYDHRYHDARNGYRAPTRWDVDGDGIPNRVDRVYNPRWDVDGDGIPNARDRFDNRKRTWR